MTPNTLAKKVAHRSPKSSQEIADELVSAYAMRSSEWCANKNLLWATRAAHREFCLHLQRVLPLNWTRRHSWLLNESRGTVSGTDGHDKLKCGVILAARCRKRSSDAVLCLCLWQTTVQDIRPRVMVWKCCDQRLAIQESWWQTNRLTVVTYSPHGLNQGKPYLVCLCNEYDFIFVQEH